MYLPSQPSSPMKDGHSVRSSLNTIQEFVAIESWSGTRFSQACHDHGIPPISAQLTWRGMIWRPFPGDLFLPDPALFPPNVL